MERRLHIVLDLDETLVHFFSAEEYAGYTELPGIPLSGGFLVLRPGAQEFVEELLEKYSVGIWTLGSTDYAVAVARILTDNPHRFKFIFSRDDNELAVLYSRVSKDLNYVWDMDSGFTAMNTLLIDDNPMNTDNIVNKQNSLKIPPFRGKPDEVLPALLRNINTIDLKIHRGGLKRSKLSRRKRLLPNRVTRRRRLI